MSFRRTLSFIATFTVLAGCGDLNNENDGLGPDGSGAAASGTGGTATGATSGSGGALGTGGVVGGGGSVGSGSTEGSGGTPGSGGSVLPNGPTTDALETVEAKYWVAYDGDSGALTWSVGDDGTGNVVVHASTTAAHAESASVSLSIPQASLTDDMARSKGVRFRMKGTGDVLFQAQSGAVIPISAGGWCDAKGGTSACWNAHEKTLENSASYKDYTILWDDLNQSYGTDTNTVVLYPSDILLLSWIIPKTKAGSFTLDAIELIADDGTGVQSGVAALISKAQFNAIVGASTSYTYDGFLAAAAAFPAFGGDADATWAKREIAMFLANAKWETGSFQFTTEQNQSGDYCDESKSYGCPAGVYQYFGRGALQLSWNYNYKAAGDYLGINLLSSPAQVATDAALLWKSALWFWMQPGNAGSVHAKYKQGLGATISTINSIECSGGNTTAVAGRKTNYQNALSALGVAAGGTDTGC